jgi:hypothetical protein
MYTGGTSTAPGSKTTTQTKNDDIAKARMEIQRKMKANGWAGADPTEYEYYKQQLISLYGESAVSDFDKELRDYSIVVDYDNE